MTLETKGAKSASTDHATPASSTGTVAARFRPILHHVFGGEPPLRFRFWDGSALGPDRGDGELAFRSRDALRRLIWAPGELGLARAYVAGDADLEGDLFTLLRQLSDELRGVRNLSARAFVAAIGTAVKVGAIGRPLRPPPEEVHLRGTAHSKTRDARAVTHHYDVGNDFYKLVLGPALTYSCARFVTADTSLEDAQRAKHDLIARKLGLHEHRGARLLDVGCGWGSMAMHAAEAYEARVVGITLSPSQVELANKRIAEAGLADRIEIRLQDYRDLKGEQFDAISSVGMFEHVGSERMSVYFRTLFDVLAPGGRLLNHAISRPGGSKLTGRTFIARYVFPDGELVDVADVVRGMEAEGYEVRDVESLREHYAQTLKHWVVNLEDNWDEAVALTSEGRARVWRLYMAASANNFEDGPLSIHQILGVKTMANGAALMPRTRLDWG
ncbi:MAG: class I SAM-dependent methyltransferase [Acidimicrobiales bacterium]